MASTITMVMVDAEVDALNPTLPTSLDAKDKKSGKSRRSRKKVEKEPTMKFSFDNVPLSEVIERYAAEKGINVVLPQGAAEIKQRITFKTDRPLTLKEAEEYLLLFLDLAGYTKRPGDDFQVYIKNENVARNPLPLFILDGNMPKALKIEDLPDDDLPIRAVYYFANLRVDDGGKGPVTVILREMLNESDSLVTDPQSNGVVISGKSRNIRSALQLLRELDSSASTHTISTIQLYNTSAVAVADLLRSQIIAVGGRTPFGLDDSSSKGPGVGTYFSTGLRIVADDRRNTLVVMGKDGPVNRLKDFVREYLDAPLESGKSVFHVYDLKYLDAEALAQVLTNVVQSTGFGGEAQVTRQQVGGPRRFFEGVIIKAETFKAVEQPDTTGTNQAGATDFDQLGSAGSGITPGTVYRGGNRLLVAANPSDWEQLRKLIDELDIPRKQALIEVLILDYSRTRNKELLSQIRNPKRWDFRDGLAFQTAHLENNIIPALDSDGNPVSIVGDLLRVLGTNGNATLASTVDPGSLVISLNDAAGTGIWGVLALLDQIGKTNILSHPYLTALNNTTAKVTSTETIRNVGSASTATGGAYSVDIADYQATLSVTITPRISSIDRLNLEIQILIQQFTDAASATRQSRVIQTNVSMSSPNQILVLGGLTQITKNEDASETPLLGRIPLIGWLFKGAGKSTIENELGVFIRPTIIEPKRRDPMNHFTRDKINQSVEDTSNDILYDKGQDPIVRFFFGREPREHTLIDAYNQEVASAILRQRPEDDPRSVPIQEQLAEELSAKTDKTS